MVSLSPINHPLHIQRVSSTFTSSRADILLLIVFQCTVRTISLNPSEEQPSSVCFQSQNPQRGPSWTPRLPAGDPPGVGLRDQCLYLGASSIKVFQLWPASLSSFFFPFFFFSIHFLRQPESKKIMKNAYGFGLWAAQVKQGLLPG